MEGELDDFAIVPADVRDLNDRMMVLGQTTGRINSTGVPIRQPVGAVLSDFRDHQIGEAHVFLTWRQALEALGLSE